MPTRSARGRGSKVCGHGVEAASEFVVHPHVEAGAGVDEGEARPPSLGRHPRLWRRTHAPHGALPPHLVGGAVAEAAAPKGAGRGRGRKGVGEYAVCGNVVDGRALRQRLYRLQQRLLRPAARW